MESQCRNLAQNKILVKNRSLKTGFTILEILIALLLVGVGVFAIMEAFNRGIFGTGDLEHHSLALSLTQERMEEIKNTTFSSIASQARAAVSGYSNFDQQVTVTSPHPDLKQVDVVTYWQVPGGENSTSLSTYAVNN